MCRRNVDLADLVAKAPLFKASRGALERAGFHDVATNREERFVDRLNHVGAGEDKVVVATFERFPAEVLGGQVEALYAGAIAPS